MADQKFYNTAITINVLSEGPIPDHMSLADIVRECDDGDFVLASGCIGSSKQKPLSKKQIVRALYAAGSEPEFFNLDNDGNKLDF